MLKACWLVCPCLSVPALFLFVLCLRRSPFWSGSGWRRSGGRRLVAAHERRPSSLFTVEPGLPQRWTCCRRGADEDKLARCKAITVKGGVSQKEIQQPRGCTFSVSKPRTNGRWRCGWFRRSVPGEKNKHGQGVVDTSLGFVKKRGMSGLSLAKKGRLTERWNGDQRGKGEERS